MESVGNEAKRESGIERGRGIEAITMLIDIQENGLAAEKGRGNIITVNVAMKTGTITIGTVSVNVSGIENSSDRGPGKECAGSKKSSVIAVHATNCCSLGP